MNVATPTLQRYALEGGEIHIHKAFPVCDADPRGGNATHIPEIRGAAAIRRAFESYAKGVLQMAAVEELLQSDRATTVLVYNPANPSVVTRVYFEGALALAA